MDSLYKIREENKALNFSEIKTELESFFETNVKKDDGLLELDLDYNIWAVLFCKELSNDKNPKDKEMVNQFLIDSIKVEYFFDNKVEMKLFGYYKEHSYSRGFKILSGSVRVLSIEEHHSFRVVKISVGEKVIALLRPNTFGDLRKLLDYDNLHEVYSLKDVKWEAFDSHEERNRDIIEKGSTDNYDILKLMLMYQMLNGNNPFAWNN